MGSLGPWHIVIAVALSLVKFPVAWHQLSIVFLAPPTNFTCIHPTPANLSDSMSGKCEVDVGGHKEKCTEFAYNRNIFKETIITQVSELFSYIFRSIDLIKCYFDVLLNRMTFIGTVAQLNCNKVYTVWLMSINYVFFLSRNHSVESIRMSESAFYYFSGI